MMKTGRQKIMHTVFPVSYTHLDVYKRQLAQFFRVISKEDSADIYKAAKDSAYYIGAVHEDEPANGAELVKILLDKGDRNIGLIGWEQGDEMCIRDRVWTDNLTGDSKLIWQTFQSTMNTKMKESITQMLSKEHTLITTVRSGISTSTTLLASQQNFLQRQLTMQQQIS